MASFIGSLLSSIGGGASPASQTNSKAPPVRPNGSVQGTIGVKRKAEGELTRPGDKVARLTNGAGNGAGPRVIRALPQRSSAADTQTPPRKPANTQLPHSAPAISNSKSSSTHSASVPRSSTPGGKFTNVSSKPGLASGNGVRSVSSSTTKPNPTKSAASNPSSAGKPAPAPGQKLTYKQKLALAAKASTKPVGGIVHGTTTISAKKRLELARAEKKKPQSQMAQRKFERLSKEVRGEKGANSVGKGKDVPAADGKSAASGKAQARPQSTYQGTARPTPNPQPSYRGTARPTAADAGRVINKPKRKNPNEYLDTDEDEEDGYGYASDDRYAEASDDYSDMDAGYDELENEEDYAAREAIRDDKREQKELERLAREKAMRKKGAGGR